MKERRNMRDPSLEKRINTIKLGHELRLKRQENGLTLQDVSSALKTAFSIIGEIETGRTQKPNLELVEKYLNLLEIPVEKQIELFASIEEIYPPAKKIFFENNLYFTKLILEEGKKGNEK